MTESWGAACPDAIVPQGTVTKRYKPPAPVLPFGSHPGPEWQPLRHWLRCEATWAVLAAAGLTHPRRVVAAALRAGMRPRWRDRGRVWSWPELQRLAEVEAERRATATDPLARLAADLAEVAR